METETNIIDRHIAEAAIGIAKRVATENLSGYGVRFAILVLRRYRKTGKVNQVIVDELYGDIFRSQAAEMIIRPYQPIKIDVARFRRPQTKQAHLVLINSAN